MLFAALGYLLGFEDGNRLFVLQEASFNNVSDVWYL